MNGQIAELPAVHAMEQATNEEQEVQQHLRLIMELLALILHKQGVVVINVQVGVHMSENFPFL